MKDKKVLIIGGTGYIGSALYQFLDYRVGVLDTVDLEFYGNHVNARNHKVDFNILPPDFLKRYSHIVLLAGNASVAACHGNPVGSFKNNVLNFIDLCQKLRGGKTTLIYASSGSVYNNDTNEPQNEKFSQFTPRADYDLQKWTVDLYAQTVTDFPIFGLRFGTVCGFSPLFRTDLFVHQMAGPYNPEIRVRDGSALRPVLCMDDLCRAIACIIEKGSLSQSGIYNLYSFQDTILSFAKQIRDLRKTIISDEPRFVVFPDSHPRHTYSFFMDRSKFCSTFNFGFDGTLEDTVRKGMFFTKALTTRSQTLLYV